MPSKTRSSAAGSIESFGPRLPRRTSTDSGCFGSQVKRDPRGGREGEHGLVELALLVERVGEALVVAAGLGVGRRRVRRKQPALDRPRGAAGGQHRVAGLEREVAPLRVAGREPRQRRDPAVDDARVAVELHARHELRRVDRGRGARDGEVDLDRIDDVRRQRVGERDAVDGLLARLRPGAPENVTQSGEASESSNRSHAEPARRKRQAPRGLGSAPAGRSSRRGRTAPSPSPRSGTGRSRGRRSGGRRGRSPPRAGRARPRRVDATTPGQRSGNASSWVRNATGPPSPRAT